MSNFPSEKNPEPQNSSDDSPDLSFIDETGVYHFVLSNKYIPLSRRNCKVYTNRYLRNNGETLEVNDEILNFRIGEMMSLGMYERSSNIIAANSGVLEIIKEPAELINVGDVIFKIVPNAVHKLSRITDGLPYKYYYNKARFHLGTSGSESILKIKKWLKDSGDYLQVDDEIIELTSTKSYSDGPVYKIKTDVGGYLEKAEVSFADSFLEDGQHLFTINSSDSARIASKYFNESLIEEDVFDKKKSLMWRIVAGLPRGFIRTCNLDGTRDLDFTFVNDKGISKILFAIKKKEIPIVKGDEVLFLFENDVVLKFNVTETPTKSFIENMKGYYEFANQIDEKELNVFCANNFVRWKVILKKIKQEVIGGELGAGFHYKSHNNLNLVIKKLVLEFMEGIKNL